MTTRSTTPDSLSVAPGLGKTVSAEMKEAEADYGRLWRACAAATAEAIKAGDAYRAAQCSFAHYNILQSLWAVHETALERQRAAVVSLDKARRRLDDLRVRAGLHEAASAFAQLNGQNTARPY